MNQAWDQYRMMEAAEMIYHFIWTDLCDWFVEGVKIDRPKYQKTLLHVVGEALKLLHPICPHLTEELWHELPGVSVDSSIGWESFPVGESFADPVATAEFEFLKVFMGSVRNLRSENKVPPGKKIKIVVLGTESLPETSKILKSEWGFVSFLTKLESVSFENRSAELKNYSRIAVSAFEQGSTFEWAVALADLVNVEEEKSRLARELENIKKLYQAQKTKLSNESFVARAPQEVIAKERIKEKELAEKLSKTEEALKQMENL
jgi:valyl-tRNA synthetase